ncbi:MAG: TIGR02302 family protein [Hyphomicrobiaceae bacterium]
MTEKKSQRAKRDPVFERKVFASKWALVFEKFWPRFWLVIGIGVIFAFLSIFGVWSMLGLWAHKGLLAFLGLSALVSLLFALRVPWPSREQAIRRIERNSKIAHRPASSYEDIVSAPGKDASTDHIWNTHRSRMAQLLAKLRVGNPQPGTHQRDPMALRLAAMVGIVMLAALAGAALPERFAAAWDFTAKNEISTARLDAWLTPPSYTRRPAVMLSDGSGAKAQSKLDGGKSVGGLIEIPTSSELVVRASGTGHEALRVEFLADTPEPEVLLPKKPEKKKDGVSTMPATVSDIRHTVTRSGRLRILRGKTELGQWTLSVVPDALPKVSFSKKPESTARGSMKLTYKIEDDYGVVSAVAKLQRKPETANEQSQSNNINLATPKNPELQKAGLSGPRVPLEPPPVLKLQIPRVGSKKAEAKTTLELAAHPWAGMKVIMTLEAEDVAGQVGKSRPLVMTLPERQFSNLLARAVIEQRRKLIEDYRYRDDVLLALEALTLEPDGFIKDAQAYLGLRSAYYRLERDQTRAGRNSVIEQLWHTALRIEDGDLSDAERRLKEAQDKLAKLLKDGASEEEIKAAMEEMRQALNEYMKQLQKQAQQNGEPPPDGGQDQDNKIVTEQDLADMMKELEEAAKNGSREKAEQMLSELRDLLDRMKSGQQDQATAEQNRQMQKQMEKLGDMMNEQKKLMDETFEERRKQQGQKQKGGQQRSGQENKGQHGQQRGQATGEAKPGQEKRWGGKRAQRGNQRRPGQQGQQGQQQQQGFGKQQLSRRQKSLQDSLNRMKQDLNELGIGDKKALDKAERAMQQAQEALKENRLQEATQQQGRALDQMREGMQELAKNMMQNTPQRYGEQQKRDPLGRPQAQDGPNEGSGVKVPSEIDRQRAREILEELRRRVGEMKRPPQELEYIERLLRRF